MFSITTSFRRCVLKAADRLSKLNYPVKLHDASRFFETLGIAQLVTASITWKQIVSHILKLGVHTCKEITKQFLEEESLADRTVILTAESSRMRCRYPRSDSFPTCTPNHAVLGAVFSLFAPPVEENRERSA